MQIISRRTNNIEPTEYAFIDAAYLREEVDEILKQCFGENVNYEDLSLDKMTHNFTKVFYYDCLPPQNSNENKDDFHVRIEPNKQFLDKIHNYKGYHVFKGSTAGIGERARQKQIDVKLSVDMLMHTIRGNMSKATLLSGDQDFNPVVESLIEEGMWVTLWCNPKSASGKLIHAADEVRKFYIATIYEALPEKIKQECRVPSHGRGEYPALENPTKVGITSNGEKVEMQVGSERTNILIFRNEPEEKSNYQGTNPNFLVNWIENSEDIKIEWKK